MMPPAFTKLHLPDERQSSCLNCPKSSYEDYRPDYRCCTYHPRISNFLLGLACETESGRIAVDELLQRGMLLPEGMHSSPRQLLDFAEDAQNDRFGKSQKVLCPLLDSASGYCRIHAFRNSVCSSYFCHKDHGSTGDLFWDHLQTLGAQLEMRLAQWALQEIGFDLDGYFEVMNALSSQFLNVSTDFGWTKEALAELWGPWYGREKELLGRTSQIISMHRDELWTIAQSQKIREANLFDEALQSAVSVYNELNMDQDNPDEDRQNFEDLADFWQSCLIAHDLLWSYPNGLFTLNPHVKFVVNTRQTVEEIYHKTKDFFLTYSMPGNDQAPDFRLAITANQKQALESFADQSRPLPRDSSFLVEMLKCKVIRI